MKTIIEQNDIVWFSIFKQTFAILQHSMNIPFSLHAQSVIDEWLDCRYLDEVRREVGQEDSSSDDELGGKADTAALGILHV